MLAARCLVLSALLATGSVQTQVPPEDSGGMKPARENWYIGKDGGSGNAVILYSNGTYVAAYGGYSNSWGGVTGIESSVASDNKLTIESSGGVTGDAGGGAVNGHTVNVQHNTLTIRGTVGGNAFGGSCVGSGQCYPGSTIKSNTVVIDGGTVKGNVVGSNTRGSTTGNTVTLKGSSTVDGAVYGGYSFSSGNATGNTVTLKGNAAVGGNVYGGASVYGLDQVSNNELQVQAKTLTVGGDVTNFATLNFTLPADIVNGDTMLTAGGAATFPAAATTVSITMESGARLHTHDEIKLITATGGLSVTPATTTITYGSYEFELSADANNLIAKVVKAPTYTITAAALPAEGGTVTCDPPIEVEYGGTVTCTATPNTDYEFGGWTSAGCSGLRCTFTGVTSDLTVRATFAGSQKELLSCDFGDTAELEFKTDANWEVYGASTGGAWQPAFVALDTTERAASAYNPTVADGDWITPGSRTGTVPTTQAYHFRRKVVVDPSIDLATVQLDRAGTKYAVDDYLNSVMVTQDRIGIPDTPGRVLVGRRNIQLYDVLEAGIDRTTGNWAAGDNYLVWKVSNVQDFHDLSNGGQPLTLLANVKITASCKALSVPIITLPADGATVGSPQLSVAGTATAGTSVQVFVDGQAAGGAVAANSTGSFSTTITLSEGAHQLTARASSARGESTMSSPVNVTYSAAVPTVAFITPPANSTLTADTAVVEASASDASGITKLELYAGDQLLATCTTASCSATWQLEGVADGNYTLRAVATNTSGRTAEATRTVTVQKASDTPPQPLALYEVQDFAITPAMSFGDVPIKITGQLVSTAGREPAASAALLLLLRTHGVDRRINLRSDANGRFDYSFVPQSTDAGTYEVRITHSDDAVNASRPADGSFTINRLSVDMSRYRFDATRGQTSTATVRVTASAGTGATGVHWKALPADQPSGSLPPGITLETGDAIDIAAGTTAPINIRLAGSDSAGATGTIILKLFANESGSTPRAELRLDYQLHEAQPRLVPDPTSLQLGVQQGATASAQVTITNKGFKPAHGVRAALQARPGHALPSWVKLISSPDIGALDVGASTVIQINASPDAEVPDGYHYAQLVVSADNDAGGSVPITIAVAREGQGNARFQFVDIYTGTTDEQGGTIEGLAGARITLQHETLSSDIRSATSNAQGIAEFEGLPPGNWRWRASAPGHIDASGRITINATATTSERVFLDYQLVTVEFSVTETTIQDVYDIVLEATYQTQVPAPVVVLEPTSINLPAMQQGEEITGELRLTNYGLVRADHLQFALPGTDENFKYEFFAELPEQLPAKSSVSIPYRITSLKPLAKGLQINLQADNKLKQIGADQQSGAQVVSAIRRFLGHGDTSVVSADTPEDTAKSAAKAASCTSYHTQACASYDYECASGDVRGGSTCASIGRITGTNCTSSSIGSYGGSCNTPACGNGGGWGGGGWGGGAASIGLVPACMPSCSDCSAGTGNP